MFVGGNRGIGVTEVAGRLGIANSTAHRLLRSLCKGGLLVQNPNTKRYELAALIHQLGNVAAAQAQLRVRSQGTLDRLHRATGEGCHIAVADMPQVRYIQRRDSPVTRRFIGRMNLRAPANCTSTGKMLLAVAATELQEEVLASGIQRLTPRSHADPSSLREELELIRQQGYAYSRDETELGITSVAAPIRDSSGAVVAALGLAGTTAGIRRLRVGTVVESVVAGGAEIGEALSGHADRLSGVSA